MGRPRPNKLNRNFAVLFAETVTIPTSHPTDYIARIGEHCLFELLLLLAPKVINPTIMCREVLDSCWPLRPSQSTRSEANGTDFPQERFRLFKLKCQMVFALNFVLQGQHLSTTDEPAS